MLTEGFNSPVLSFVPTISWTHNHVRQCVTKRVSSPLQPSPQPYVFLTPLAFAASGKKSRKNYSPTVVNRIAHFRYDILETHECGIELLGTEIKSVREGGLNLREGYARVKDGEIFLHNVHISSWTMAHKAYNHEPLRVRRLLLHKRVIRRLEVRQTEIGLTLIPLKSYFSSNNYLKIEIGLARGKKLHDKREDEKKREADRDIKRAVKDFVTR